MHLLECQIKRFVLAGGVSGDAVDIDKEPTNMIGSTCSRDVCSSCLMDNPPSGRMSPIGVAKEVTPDTWYERRRMQGLSLPAPLEAATLRISPWAVEWCIIGLS